MKNLTFTYCVLSVFKILCVERERVRKYWALSIVAVLCSVNAWALDTRIEFRNAKQSAMTQFALEKLQVSLSSELYFTNVYHVIVNEDLSLEPQSFRVQSSRGVLTLSGADQHGLMYGLLEIEERLRFGMNIDHVEFEQSPYLDKRGLKFNVPLDARTPSYDDTGDAAQSNIKHVWDIQFWKDYLDDMALNRYNQLTLWNPQPFTSLLKLDAFPGLALENVYVTDALLTEKVMVWGEPGGVSKLVTDNLRLVKKMSIDEKIAFWREMMAYAKRRGIDVYFITWSIYTNGIYAKHGIDDAIDNPKTLAFFREAAKELVLTYPDLKGIGVTAGENMAADGSVEGWTREKWLWESYGLGLLDAKKIQPERKVDFIHRFWYSTSNEIEKVWGDYPGNFAYSFKYLMARMYSSPEPSHLLPKILPMLGNNLERKSWWNLRNDDIYVLRWGDPDYARTLYRNLPMAVTEGVHMGSDGYVWGRVHSEKSDSMKGKLELEKHWYNFMIWGRLAYNNQLNRLFFENQLEDRFPGVNASALYDAWAASSKIIPLVNQYQFQPGDRRFSPESCSSRETFRYVNDFKVSTPMPGTGVINAREYVRSILQDVDISEKVSPLDIANKIYGESTASLASLKLLEKNILNEELRLTLEDIEAMAYLGMYYAEKIRTAVSLEFFEKHALREKYSFQATQHMNSALKHWKAYARLASSNYEPQILARTGVLDWDLLTKEVEYEYALVQQIITQALMLPESNDPEKLLEINFIKGLQGTQMHEALHVQTPDAGEFYLEVYEKNGVLLNTYHSYGSGAMRWEWLQELQYQMKGRIHLNLKWQKLNRMITVNF